MEREPIRSILKDTHSKRGDSPIEIDILQKAGINKGFISTGKGPDTISFSGGLTLKGQTTIESGNGKDVIEVGESVNGNGSLLLADFSKKDRLKVGDDTLKLKDIKSGDAPSFIDLG